MSGERRVRCRKGERREGRSQRLRAEPASPEPRSRAVAGRRPLVKAGLLSDRLVFVERPVRFVAVREAAHHGLHQFLVLDFLGPQLSSKSTRRPDC